MEILLGRCLFDLYAPRTGQGVLQILLKSPFFIAVLRVVDEHADLI
jgi:hypothetical protein